MKRKLLIVVTVLMITTGLLVSACTAAETDISSSSSAPSSVPASNAPDESTVDMEEPEDDLSSKIAQADEQSSMLMISDGKHKMIDYMETPPDLPEKPTDEKLLEYYYKQYAGREVKQENIPVSPKDGSWGKTVYLIVSGDHPSLTALAEAAQAVAEIYGIELIVKSPNFDLNQQNQIIDQAIQDKPDYILLMPIDQEASTAQFKKINEAGIPCSAFLSMPANDAFKYIIGYSGTEDWMNYQELADKAGAMVDNQSGGVVYMTHLPGDSSYYSRYLGFEAELESKYPGYKTLEAVSPGSLDAQKSLQMLSDVLVKYGDQIKMIEMADDATYGTSLQQAAENTGFDLTKCIVASSGNSKAGMELIHQGVIDIMVFQSLEQCGAVPMRLVADWFNGKDVSRFAFLNPGTITLDTVEDYEPASW